MKRWAMFVVGAWSAFAAAPSGTISGLHVPLFDKAGRATRQLTGNVSGSLQQLKLSDAVVDFFAPEKLAGASVARLFLDEAIYLRAESAVTGVGELRFRAPEGRITGKGYRYELSSDRLVIRDGFRIELPDSIIEGREADVRLGRANGEVVIASFEARGGVVVTLSELGKFGFERARSDKAWYSATDEILHIASPVRGFVKEHDKSSGVVTEREIPLGADTIQVKLDRKR